MRTVRLDLLVFGYRRLVFEDSSDRARALGALMHEGISATSEGELCVLIRERDYLKNKNYIVGQKCKIAEEPRGALPLLKRALAAKISLAATLISLLVFFLAPSLIWDVRVIGCESISEAEVEESLAMLGVSVGSPWRRVDTAEAEIGLLDSSPKIGWVSINRRGSVAYVEILEADIPPDDATDVGYSNIVASRDCVIRDISVTSGYAAVEVGDVVRRGEVLISGIPPAEVGGAFCYADGVVIGECDGEITVEIPREYTETEVDDGRKSAISLEILNFSINIFKIYGNSSEEYVIIENNEKCRLFGRYELPIAIVTEYSVPSAERVRSLSDSELVDRASQRMRELILSETSEAELLRISTSGAFTDSGYSMRTAITVLEEVSVSSPIAVE